jgi:hypothetical protein
MATPSILAELPKYTREAVRFYWETRSRQLQKQRDAGGSDQGFRSAATGGAQMNGFIEVFTQLVIEAGIDRAHIFYDQSLELPGYFRPNKKWNFIVVVKGQLVAALKTKAHRGPFSDDNRGAQQTICDVLDLWAAYRTAPDACPRPWVGFLMLVEAPTPPGEVRCKESPAVQPCMEFCRRLILERFYDSSALVISNPEEKDSEPRSEPCDGISFERLAIALFMRAAVFSGRITDLPPRLSVAC